MWKKLLLVGSMLALGFTSTAMDTHAATYKNDYIVDTSGSYKGSSNHVVDSIYMHLKFPDKSQRPSSGEEAYDLVLDGKRYHNGGLGHTGWGGVAYVCNYTPAWYPYMNPTKDKWGNTGWAGGYPTREQAIAWGIALTGYWEYVGQYVTNDGSRTYPADGEHIGAEVLAKYGKELQDYAVQSGKEFAVDESIGRPMLIESDFIAQTHESMVGDFTYGGSYGDNGYHNEYGKDKGQWDSRCSTGEKSGLYRDFDFFVKLNFDLVYEVVEDGYSQGKTYWELEKSGGDADSHVAVFSEYEVPYAQHKAVRNVKHQVKAGSKIENINESAEVVSDFASTGNEQKTIEFTVDTKSTKNKDLTYEFSYEYTNKEIGWVCTGSGYSQSCTYDTNPDWRASRTYTLEGSIPMDHKHGETIKASTLDEIVSQEFVVGRMDEWDKDKNKKSSVYHENWQRTETVPSSFNLKTQTHLPILQGAMSYAVGVPSEKHKEGNYMPIKSKGSQGHFLTNDIDESLQASYTNTTEYGYNYEIPMKQHVFKTKGLSGDKRTYDWNYTTDLFVISEHAGLITEGTYTDGVSLNSAPLMDSYVVDAVSKMPVRYLAATNEQYIDTELNKGDMDKLQRYYLPVTPDSIYHPNTQYVNGIVYRDMGLNDLKFEFEQKFKFNHYLFGTAKDDAWIVEQVDSRTDVPTLNESNAHTIRITNDQIVALANAQRERTDIRMHDFRIADRDYMEKVKEIVDF